MVEQEIDNDMIKWYIVGCQIIQKGDLNDFNKKKFKEFLKTLSLMAEFE